MSQSAVTDAQSRFREPACGETRGSTDHVQRHTERPVLRAPACTAALFFGSGRAVRRSQTKALRADRLLRRRVAAARGFRNSVGGAHDLGVEIADGYARATGTVGVAMTGTGPGATNTLTGIAACYADNIPVLLLMGQHPLRNLGKEYQQEVSASIFDGLVKWRGTFTRVDDIPGNIL